VQAVRQGNKRRGWPTGRLSGREYMVRGRGYVKSWRSGKLVLKTRRHPDHGQDVGSVRSGRRCGGALQLHGQGDVVVAFRGHAPGGNALKVIDRVKAKLTS